MARTRGQKVDWPERVDAARRAHPSIDALSSAQVDRSIAAWHAALEDYTVFGGIMRDILEAEVAERAGPGRKPRLTREAGEAALQRLTGQDFSGEQFVVAVRALTGSTPLAQIAEKTGLSKTNLHRLLAGQRAPTPDELERIAGAFGKAAWYFAEYRVMSITALLDTHLTRSPETSMAWFRKLGLDGGSPK